MTALDRQRWCRRGLLLLACVLVVGLSACRPPTVPESSTGVAAVSTPPDPSVLATVGDAEIRRADLDHELARRKARGLSAEPSVVLQDLVRREALVAMAREAGLDHDPDVVRGMKQVLIGALKERELARATASAAPERPDPAGEPQGRRARVLRQEERDTGLGAALSQAVRERELEEQALARFPPRLLQPLETAKSSARSATNATLTVSLP